MTTPAPPRRRWLRFAASLLLAGCGSYFPPSPTTRPVAVGDIAGTWRFEPLGYRDTVSLVLESDGSLQQIVRTSNGQSLKAAGSWSIDGAKVNLEGVLVNFDGWNPRGEQWSVIDRDESPTGFAILGGAIDPDQWVILRFVR